MKWRQSSKGSTPLQVDWLELDKDKMKANMESIEAIEWAIKELDQAIRISLYWLIYSKVSKFWNSRTKKHMFMVTPNSFISVM